MHTARAVALVLSVWATICAGLPGQNTDPSTNVNNYPAWYIDSAAATSHGIVEGRSQNDFKAKSDAKMDELRKLSFDGMRGRPLRETSEYAVRFFEFTPHQRNDTVDRWHIPDVLADHYSSLSTDAERVSLLNYYLFVTDRDPLPATDLGFTPTMMLPGIPEGANEVGYGYALQGQHQYHCAEFLSDAIEVGKCNINDFYLQHVIHCLGLIKHLATKLTTPEPLTLLNPEAEALIKAGIPQTKAGYKKGVCN